MAEIGSVKIFPTVLANPERLKLLPKSRLPNPRLSFFEEDSGEQADSVSVEPPVTTITSKWIFTTEMEADSASDAEEKADAALGEALSALHLIAGEPYVAEVLRVEGPRHGYGRSNWAAGYAVDYDELLEDQVDKANSLLPKLSSTATSRTAADFIRKAVSLQHAAGVVAELGPSVFLNYFMAIERIANDVTSDLRRELAASLDTDVEAAARTLREQLATPDLSDSDAVDLIRDASKEFSRIQFHYADLKIERAGQNLGLGDALADDARRFSKFRNTYLGHPRTAIPRQQSSYWAEDERAFKISNAFLRAYLERVGDVRRFGEDFLGV
jgi:hypothetical protein